MRDKSPVEVAVLVIAGLIDGSERRVEAMAPLSAAVESAVAELVALDPPGRRRDTSPTWWQDLDHWTRLDPTDRLRLCHDQLLVLEVGAAEIVMGLRAMLAPHPARFDYATDYGRLCRMADERATHLERMYLAERRVKPQLSAEVAKGLSRARRGVVAEEQRGRRQRDRLGALLTMADRVMAS